MDRYTARINLHGDTQRKRIINHLHQDLITKSKNNPSYKQVKLNGIDTQLIINSGTATFNKTFVSLPGQKVLAGDYIEWANQVWLVYESDCDDEVYTDGSLRQCQNKIYWQNPEGVIKSRYVWTQNASAYNNGEQGNSTITLQSNQFMIYIPYDDDTKYLDNGIRIHMSKSNMKCRPYVLTRPDDLSYGYGEKGILNIIFTQDQYSGEKDKLVTLDDGSKVWICDYHSPAPSPVPPAPDETTDLSAIISGGNTLRCGRAKTWTVTFLDRGGNEVTDCEFKWSVESAFNVEQTIDGRKIRLRIDDENCIGSSFLLSTNNKNVLFAQVEIKIIEGL